jgi:hypothetical protein
MLSIARFRELCHYVITHVDKPAGEIHTIADLREYLVRIKAQGNADLFWPASELPFLEAEAGRYDNDTPLTRFLPEPRAGNDDETRGDAE